jgi:predicted acyltransferase (DUF342 family)
MWTWTMSCFVAGDCTIAPTARIGGRAVLESGVHVGDHTTIERAVVLRGARIGAHCTLRGCIVGAGGEIGDDTHVEGLAVLGEACPGAQFMPAGHVASGFCSFERLGAAVCAETAPAAKTAPAIMLRRNLDMTPSGG